MPTQAPVVQLNVGGIIMDLETKTGMGRRGRSETNPQLNTAF